MLVQLVLLNAFLFELLFYRKATVSIPAFSVVNTASILFAILLPLLTWRLLKPLILKAREGANYEESYKRLLYNPDIFNSLLDYQPRVAEGWENLGIDIGNREAGNIIIKVCNPYCDPCAKMHPILEDVIEKSKNARLKIIFTSSASPDDLKSRPAFHLLTIAKETNEQKTKNALNEWYLHSDRNYEKFTMQYPLHADLKDLDREYYAMKNWCDETGIRHTPTLFVNGRRLPETYNVEELKNIL